MNVLFCLPWNDLIISRCQIRQDKVKVVLPQWCRQIFFRTSVACLEIKSTVSCGTLNAWTQNCLSTCWDSECSSRPLATWPIWPSPLIESMAVNALSSLLGIKAIKDSFPVPRSSAGDFAIGWIAARLCWNSLYHFWPCDKVEGQYQSHVIWHLRWQAKWLVKNFIFLSLK